MKDQLKTIREALVLERFACIHESLNVPDHLVSALTALDQIEKMVGEQEPVHQFRSPRCSDWYDGIPDHHDGHGPYEVRTLYATPVVQRQEPVAWLRKNGFRFLGVAEPQDDSELPLYAAPVAQQPQARPDFTDEWTGYLKNGETPFERFLRERKDLTTLTKLYQRALEENESLKAQQPQAEPDIHEAQGQIEFLDKKNNALSAAIRKVMARLADLLDEDQFKEIEEAISSAGVQPQAEAVPAVDRVYEAAKRLVDHADFQLGGVLSAKSKARDIPSNAASKVKARHLASLRDALAKTPQQAEAVPMTDSQIEHALRAEPMADNEESFALGIRHAERHHGIVGKEGA